MTEPRLSPRVWEAIKLSSKPTNQTVFRLSMVPFTFNALNRKTPIENATSYVDCHWLLRAIPLFHRCSARKEEQPDRSTKDSAYCPTDPETPSTIGRKYSL